MLEVEAEAIRAKQRKSRHTSNRGMKNAFKIKPQEIAI